MVCLFLDGGVHITSKELSVGLDFHFADCSVCDVGETISR